MTRTRADRRRLAPALTLLGALTLAACGGRGADAVVTRDTATVVVLGPRDVATATARPVLGGVSITGSLDPAERVEIKAQLGGQLSELLADRGTAVRSGQALARYDDATVRAQAASAAARLSAARRDFAAADTLFKAGAVSQRDHANARAALDAAIAQAAQADESLERATVTSPIAGVVSDRMVSSGEAVRVGDPLFTVVDASALELAGRIGPDEVAAVRVGQRVSLRLDAYPDREIGGAVTRIEPMADPNTRQVGVYVRVPNAGRSLVAGLFATGTIMTGASASAAREVLAVPLSAVRTDNGHAVVYVVDGGVIRVQAVSLGARDATSGFVQVRTGLAAGAMVVVSPSERLTPGVRVRLGTDRAAADSAATARKAGR